MADSFTVVTAYASHQLVCELLKTMILNDGETVLQALERAGVDVNVADCSGKTLLMHAVHFAAKHKYKTDKLRKKLLAGITYLVRNGANLNLADECGETAFGLALKLGQKDIAKLMLIHGANFPSTIN